MALSAPVRLVSEGKAADPLRFNFNKGQLERQRPGDRQRWVYDAKCDGLAMLTTPGGVKTFYLAKRIEGRYRRVKVGRFPGVTVEQARKQADKLRGEIVQGVNVADRRKAKVRAVTTLGGMFAWYLEHYAKVHKRTWAEDQRQYDTYLSGWANRRLDSITRDDVRQIHQRIGKGAPVAANRVLALLSKLYTEAGNSGYNGPTPTKGVKRYREHSRERFLGVDELPRMLQSIEDDQSEAIRDYFKLLLFTGQRRSNVAELRWDELDLQRNVWTIPAAKFKTGVAVEVPLVPQAVDVLASRKAGTDGDYVFPSRTASRQPYMTEPTIGFRRICKRAGITGLRIHDLRRTVASWATMQGVPFPIVAKLAGHKVSTVTGIYARFDLAAVREGLEKTVNAMLAAKGGA